MAVSDKVMRHLHKASEGGGRARRSDVPARARAPRPALHDHLRRRSPDRAGRRVRRPGARGARRPRAARHHPRRRPRDVGLRRRLLPASRPQRGRGSSEGRVEHGARPLRRDAARLLRRGSARRRHGSRRCVRDALLPVADRRLRGHDLRQAARTPSSASRACGRGTTGTSTSGPARIPIASSRSSSRGCRIPRSRPPTSAATPSAVSRP